MPVEQREEAEVRDVMVRKTVESVVKALSETKIDSDEKYTAAEQFLVKCKETMTMVTNHYEADRVEAKAKYDLILSKKKVLMGPLEDADKVVRSQMTTWSTMRERKRREEAAKLESELRKKAEDEKLEQAETLQAMGRDTKAEELISSKTSVSKAAIQAVATETKVGATMEKWMVKVENKLEFLKDLVNGPGYVGLLECVEVSEVKLAAYAKANPGFKMPGLTVEQTFVPVIGGRR